ncbi:MAG: hypothetical protein NT059_05545 [Planctomycetota bacterium]|nr:hypothetical protein [Planctomycetota bacterium]
MVDHSDRSLNLCQVRPWFARWNVPVAAHRNERVSLARAGQIGGRGVNCSWFTDFAWNPKLAPLGDR